MYEKVKRYIIGKPLENEAIDGEKFGVLWGVPILASDAISSVAYAGQEILIVLLPLIGVAAYSKLPLIAFIVIGLLMILTTSYRQTIDQYPNGGGAYVVAGENIGKVAGICAGAALSVDYIMTVAVSVSSAVEQITSVYQHLKIYSVLIGLAIILLLTIGNLRGIRESSVLFGIPSYAFVFGIVIMMIVGFFNFHGSSSVQVVSTDQDILQPFTFLILLKAFSSGCTALSGVEAICNAVPSFKSPSQKNAKLVLLILSSLVLLLFGGTAVLASFYHPDITHTTMLVQLAEQVFGKSFMYYYVTFTTSLILIMAANTAYSGFPLLMAIMGKDGYVPRQLNMRGDRLSFSNGILILSVVASILVIGFRANVKSLTGLYAIGVFVSFTLSQAGMFFKWKREKSQGWLPKAIVNGAGAIATAVAVIIIAITKFPEGAWLVIIIIPFLIYTMQRIKKHYGDVASQLSLSSYEVEEEDPINKHYENRVIVPIASVNKASVRALRYANTISGNVVAFCVVVDQESEAKVKEKYALLKTDIPLVIKYSPYRKVVDPLVKYIESEEYSIKKGEIITVILPQFIVKSKHENFLHNQTGLYVRRELLKYKHIVVATMPLQLKKNN